MEVGRLVEHDAHVLLKMAAALAHDPARAAAGAVGNCDLPRALYVFAQLVGRDCVAVEVDGLLHGDNAHNAHAARQIRRH